MEQSPILEIYAYGDVEMLFRPCVDCGLYTGSYCDYCMAEHRDPTGVYAEGQMTPLCSSCDNKYGECRYCREVPWCAPPPHCRSRDGVLW